MVMFIFELLFGGIWLIVLLIVFLSLSVRIVYEFERAILFNFGRYGGELKPGLNFIIPIYQTVQKVDMRIKTVDIPKQEVMTKDNVPAAINAVVYFRVQDSKKAVLNIQDYTYAVAQYGQTAIRDIIGGITLDEVLTKRDEIADTIKEIVDKETDQWGIDVTAIKMQDVELPVDLKRTMAKEAEAERERRSNIIKAEGEVIAAQNYKKAAQALSSTAGGLHLRTLQSVNDMSSDQSNTVVFMMPLEVLRAFETFSDTFAPEKTTKTVKKK